MATQSVVERLGEYLAHVTFDSMPPDVVELGKTRILNAMAVSIPGAHIAGSIAAWKAMLHNKGPCSIIGHAEKVPAPDAALANGVAGHVLLQEDIGSGGHPGPVIIPTALAVGEQVSASGKEILTAIVMGYETQGRIFRGLTQHQSRAGFRSVSMIGVFGAAATASRLLKLDQAKTANALAFSASLASGVYQGFAEGTADCFYQAGFAARNGITAALIAEQGGLASPLALEGANGFYRAFTGSTERVPEVVKGLGETFDIRGIQSKPYGTSSGNHDPIDLAVSIGRQLRSPKDIKWVILTVPASTRATAGKDSLPPYRNMTMAQMSLRFCVAAALLQRPITSYEYFRDHYDDAEVEDLAYRTQVVGEEGRRIAALEVRLQDGKSIRLEEDRSHKWKPDTQALEKFFHETTRSVLDRSKGEKIVETIMRLDKVKDIHELTVQLSS
ncbi:MAG: MmgE/PrpD family protein [Dehalococcoidia bacterium]|nr:MmgE/PrpD family protein [Dehalococcoidia bacterium]